MEKLREEGRKEIRDIVTAAAISGAITGPAKTVLEEKGVIITKK